MGGFGSSEVLDIEYEEINHALSVVARRAREFLGLPHKPIRVPFLKATPNSLAEAIENFAEVRERLSATPWVGQIDETGEV